MTVAEHKNVAAAIKLLQKALELLEHEESLTPNLLPSPDWVQVGFVCVCVCVRASASASASASACVRLL